MNKMFKNNALTTIKKDNIVIKCCCDDISKILEKISSENIKAFNLIYNLTNPGDNKFVKGKGVSKCLPEDVYDEKVGESIAFVKAKLNANIKKRRLLQKMYKFNNELTKTINEELSKLDKYIDKDIEKIRVYNPKYEV